MEELFGRVYPAAFAHRAERRGGRRHAERRWSEPDRAALLARRLGPWQERCGGRALCQTGAARAGHRAGARAQSVGVHLLRHPDLSGRRRRGRGDRSRARPARACRRAGARDRRTAGRRDHVHPHPPRPQPGGAAARRARPARRSSAARRWRWRRSARAPTRRSTATMRPTACSPTARRSRSTARRVVAVATPGHTSNHLCFAYRRRACSPATMSWAGRRPSSSRPTATWPPTWRASTSCGSATTASIIRRTGRR